MLQHRVTCVRSLFAVIAALAVASGSACAQGAPATTAAASRPGPGCVDDGPPQTGLPHEALTVQTSRGPVRLDVQVAATEQTREKGLMFVRAMPQDEGMLFDFQPAQPVAFWMHNTYLPLDLLFVGEDGRILNIARNARTCDDTRIPSRGAARAVIELNAGAAERLGSRAGDRVTGQRIFRAR